jgi:5-methylcytosine-specific restriction endonuclease McrA
MRPDDEEVFAREGFKCVYCGFDGRSFEGWVFLQVDHFKPRSRGGSDELDNLCTSCAICNFMKGAHTWDSLGEARAEMGEWRSKMKEYWETKVRGRVP